MVNQYPERRAQRSRLPGRVPEREFGRSCPLHEETDVVFVGHPHAPEHLHRLVGNVHVRLGTLGLGQRHQAGGFRALGIDGTRRGHDGRARQLAVDEQARGPMFQGLEGSDPDAKLLALAQVGHRHLERLLHAAQHLAAKRHRRTVDGLLEHAAARVRTAEQRIGSEFNVERNQRGATRIHACLALAGDPLRVAGHEEETDPRGLARLARRAGCHDEAVGHVAVEHRRFRTAQVPTVTLGRGGGGDVSAIPTSTLLLESQGKNRLPRHEGRKPSLLLGLRPRQRDRLSSQERRKKRLGQKRTPRGFHDEHHLRVAQAATAHGLGEHDAHPTEFGHLGPETPGKNPARRRHRATPGFAKTALSSARKSTAVFAISSWSSERTISMLACLRVGIRRQSGSPRTCFAMMFNCTSEVPPSMVLPRERSHSRVRSISSSP